MKTGGEGVGGGRWWWWTVVVWLCVIEVVVAEASHSQTERGEQRGGGGVWCVTRSVWWPQASHLKTRRGDGEAGGVWKVVVGWGMVAGAGNCVCQATGAGVAPPPSLRV